MGYSVRTDKVRYTEWRDWKTGRIAARELYDTEQDRAELVNSIDRPQDPAALREAEELLRPQIKAVPR